LWSIIRFGSVTSNIFWLMSNDCLKTPKKEGS
jgi:hypothetical protein